MAETAVGGHAIVPVTRTNGDVVYIRPDQITGGKDVVATFDENGKRASRDLRTADIGGAPEGSGFWETGLGNYLRDSYDGLARGAKAAREAVDSVTPGPALFASMLPGAGLVQGHEDFGRGQRAMSEGRYKDAAIDYGLGVVNAGTDMIPGMAALPPLVVKSANMPPVPRQTEAGIVSKPWTRRDDFRLTGATLRKAEDTGESPYIAASMTPAVGTTVRPGQSADDVMKGLVDSYQPGRGLPDQVGGGDADAFQRWLESDPAARALIDKRIAEAQKNGLMPPPDQDDSDLWLAIHAERNPRSGWARWMGPDAPVERRSGVEQRARELDEAESARMAEGDRRRAAFDAYMAAGYMPPSPQGQAAWREQNPHREPSHFAYDQSTGEWWVSSSPNSLDPRDRIGP